jgi:putative iron-dependent peroxidase
MTHMHQPLVLEPVRPSARYLHWNLVGDAAPALAALAKLRLDADVVVGVGAPVAAALRANVEGLRAFPSHLPLFPSTQSALWVCTAHPEKGAQLDAGMKIARTLKGAFEIVEEVDGFTYLGGRDLSGFVDGTENPHGDAAADAALVKGGDGYDGGSFCAVQRWVHDLGALDRMTEKTRDHVVGRRLEDDEELADAPPSAHVKRTAQESFDPAAFMVRRSMPWGGVREHGLYFVAYVENLNRFERMAERMAGASDGVVDGLFSFTRPLTGSYFFCPPVDDGHLDLRALGL